MVAIQQNSYNQKIVMMIMTMIMMMLMIITYKMTVATNYSWKFTVKEWK